MTAPTDFGGFDLAIGEVYGLRVWRIDELGRLKPRYIDGAQPWKPGVNEAHCYATSPANSMFAMQNWLGFQAWFATAVSGTSPDYDEDEPEPTPAHPAPHEGCQCGFYAYTGPGREVYRDQPATVLGIIRGTGRTLIGTRGFRCEKAEIVALLDPVADPFQEPWGEWQHDLLTAAYPDVPLLASKPALREFAPIEGGACPLSTDDFWSLP